LRSAFLFGEFPELWSELSSEIVDPQDWCGLAHRLPLSVRGREKVEAVVGSPHNGVIGRRG